MPKARATRIHVVRHGRVNDAWRGRIYGDLDVELAPAGEEEARASARRLAGVELAAVISSGLSRASFGAALLCVGRGLEPRSEARLREICRGSWCGRTFAELARDDPRTFAAWQADPTFRPPQGESLADLAARVVPALDDLAREFAGREVAVVAHSWVARVACAHALGLPLSAAHRFDLPTGGLVVLDWPAAPDLAPALAAFVTDAPPPRTTRWFRGPERALRPSERNG